MPALGAVVRIEGAFSTTSRKLTPTAARRIDRTQGGLAFAEQYRSGNRFLFDPLKNLEIGPDVYY